MKSKLSWALAIVASMALGAGVVVGIDSLRSDEPITTLIERVASSDNSVSVSIPDDVADLYAQVRPSIVQISGQGRSGSGLGSGIILDKQGHILTNNHVVSGMTALDVTMADGTSAEATIVGQDPGNDLAVIKVNVAADKLKPAALGDSSKVRVGEFVIAVGNPFGIEGSLTQGIVSGVGRTLSGGAGRPLRELIQSDAAINPGNSGGALFNRNGEVIGVTTAIENPSGDRVFVGIGYAVPINTASRFLPDLLAGRQIQHPRMGIGLQNVTPALAESLGLNVDKGVLITSVESSAAAGRAGLRGGAGGNGRAVGDVIVAIDDTEVDTFDALARYIDSKKVGDRISVDVIRDGREMTIEVTLEAWQETTA
jgi:S1-C subfamily serine protease